MLRSDGRVILVSGASRGIGRAVVDRLLGSGFTVSAGLRDITRLMPGERLSTHAYDAGDRDAASRWVSEAVARCRRRGRRPGRDVADQRQGAVADDPRGPSLSCRLRYGAGDQSRLALRQAG